MGLILGIDPGSQKTGFGLIDNHSSDAKYVSSGVIRLPPNASLAEKLLVLNESLRVLISEFGPSEAAIEQVFFARNANTALKLGHARGAAMVACGLHGIEVYEYAAKQIKKAVTGSGSASKEQVQFMIKQLLRLPDTPPEDAADALACALCHGSSRNTQLAAGASDFGAGRMK